MRIAFLMNGMTGYLDAEFRQLHKLGNALLVVSPGREAGFEAMQDTAFEGLSTEDYAQVVGWHTPPKPAELVKLVTEFKPDAVIMTSWNFTPAYRAVMKAVPSSVVRMLIMDNLWRAAPKQWLGRLVSRFYVQPVADAALVPSDRSDFYARRLGFGPADIVRGSLSCDVELFSAGPHTADEFARRRSFIYVGRLVHHKGADVLADAYRRYRELVDDPWDLDVVGIGPYEPALRDQAGVHMHGFQQPPQVARLMAGAGCLVVPSRIEPYGVVVHEGVTSGLPVLCTDFAGAVAAFVQDGYNGWQVPTGDVEAWARTMARVSALPPQRLAAMSTVSRALSTRLSPAGWAQNLHDEIERRRAAGGDRLS